MNYEVLLDEIMVNTIGAKELITPPQREIHHGVCPLQLEYHTSIFLAGTLLAFWQERPMIFLVQVEDLPEDLMVYTGEIWPHFWKTYKLWNQLSFPFSETKDNAYPYLDKLFAYLAVLNSNTNHQVLFVKKGVKIWPLSSLLQEQINAGYGLLILSNAYQNIPSEQAKQLSSQLIKKCKTQLMEEELQEQFPALACLQTLYQQKDESTILDHLINTWDLGLDTEKSTSLRYFIN